MHNRPQLPHPAAGSPLAAPHLPARGRRASRAATAAARLLGWGDSGRVPAGPCAGYTWAAGSISSEPLLLPLSMVKRTRFSVRGVATGGPSHSGEAGRDGLTVAHRTAIGCGRCGGQAEELWGNLGNGAQPPPPAAHTQIQHL